MLKLFEGFCWEAFQTCHTLCMCTMYMLTLHSKICCIMNVHLEVPKTRRYEGAHCCVELMMAKTKFRA